MIEWILTGREFANCNCAHGCPCQFNALPKIMQDQETNPWRPSGR